KIESPINFAKVKEWKNVLVFEVRAYLGFTQETSARCDIMNKVRANNLDSYQTTKSGQLMGKVHFSHSPNIDATHQFIIAKACAALLFHIQTVLLSHHNRECLPVIC